MKFPPGLDFDKILHIALYEIHIATIGWVSGQPLNEVAFMNHLIERLTRCRSSYDFGLESPITMESCVEFLHRWGINQADQNGFDIAVTVYLYDVTFLKTALFQIKKSSNLKLTFEKWQLEQVIIDNRICERSFVFAVDDTRNCMRIESVNNLIPLYEDNQKYKKFDSSNWFGFSQWLLQWFSCEIGLPDNPKDPHYIELLLQKFVIEPRPYAPWEGDSELAYEYPKNYLLVRVWLQMMFGKGKNLKDGA
jgi:hypothetical protein